MSILKDIDIIVAFTIMVIYGILFFGIWRIIRNNKGVDDVELLPEDDKRSFVRYYAISLIVAFIGAIFSLGFLLLKDKPW